MSESLTPDQLQEAWTLLQVSPQLNERSYLQKKSSLAKHISDIDFKISKGKWKWWPAWQYWDFHRFPVFCHDCGKEKCVPEFNQSGNAFATLINIHCPVCNMMMYRNEAWYSRHTRDRASAST
jgi:hypothetical protein